MFFQPLVTNYLFSDTSMPDISLPSLPAIEHNDYIVVETPNGRTQTRNTKRKKPIEQFEEDPEFNTPSPSKEFKIGFGQKSAVQRFAKLKSLFL